MNSMLTFTSVCQCFLLCETEKQRINTELSKGQERNNQWREKKAKAINIHSLCLSQLFYIGIANYMPRIRHHCPHLRIQRGPVLLLSSTSPLPVLLAETRLLNTNQCDDLHIRHSCQHELSHHYNDSAHHQCSCCQSSIITRINPIANARQCVTHACFTSHWSPCFTHLWPNHWLTWCSPEFIGKYFSF